MFRFEHKKVGITREGEGHVIFPHKHAKSACNIKACFKILQAAQASEAKLSTVFPNKENSSRNVPFKMFKSCSSCRVW